jgi:hypothetical protein
MYLYLTAYMEIVETEVPVLVYLIRAEPIRDPGNLDACGVEVSSKLSSLSSLLFLRLPIFFSSLNEHVALVLDLLFSTPARRFRSGTNRHKWGLIYHQLRLN